MGETDPPALQKREGRPPEASRLKGRDCACAILKSVVTGVNVGKDDNPTREGESVTSSSFVSVADSSERELGRVFLTGPFAARTSKEELLPPGCPDPSKGTR
jgi:hypothetical protein